MKKSVLKNFAIFLRCFPVNIAKLLRTPNLKFTESLHRIFQYLTFTFFSSVFYGIFEQFHFQFFTTVEELYLNFLIFLSLLSRITLTNRIIHNVKNIFILHINIDCKFIVIQSELRVDIRYNRFSESGFNTDSWSNIFAIGSFFKELYQWL